MSDLSRLLKRAFENKGNKDVYRSGEYEVVFEQRTWETLFWVYYNRLPVLEGNTLDKEVALCTSESVHPYKKLLNAVWEALPGYKIVGELYEEYMESEGQKRLLEAVDYAIYDALREEQDHLVLVNEDGEFSPCRACMASTWVDADEKIVGKVEWFCVGGVPKAGFVEFEEPLTVAEYIEKNGLCENVGELIENASERRKQAAEVQKENIEIER